MKLYSYWRSTTSYRTRIVLHLKAIDFQTIAVDLVNGEQLAEDYTSLNRSQGVPALTLDDGQVLTQSMAIINYLDTIAPNPGLLPEDPYHAAQINAASNIIACDIHPVNNLKVVNKLKALGINQDQATDWMNHWMHEGFSAFNQLIDDSGQYCFGDEITLADVCLVPQLYNAHRWGLDTTPFTRLLDIEKNCLELQAFKAAAPEQQPDAQ